MDLLYFICCKLPFLIMTFLTTTVPTYDIPQSPILLLGFAGILVALVTLYVANRKYFNSPFNEDN
tara:strand:+ start:125 stop:319 length:195 start_codon:yes stop_codon:yes gene_type:complete